MGKPLTWNEVRVNGKIYPSPFLLDFLRLVLSFFSHALKYIIDRLPCEQFFSQFGVVPMAFLILKQESKALGHSQQIGELVNRPMGEWENH
jgi:hypothetical protein